MVSKHSRYCLIDGSVQRKGGAAELVQLLLGVSRTPPPHPTPPRAGGALLCTRTDAEVRALVRTFPETAGLDFFRNNSPAKVMRHLVGRGVLQASWEEGKTVIG